jgi:hypothetical protein
MSAYTHLLSRHKAEQTKIVQEAVNISTQEEANKLFYEFSMFRDRHKEFPPRSALYRNTPSAAGDIQAITTSNNIH